MLIKTRYPSQFLKPSLCTLNICEFTDLPRCVPVHRTAISVLTLGLIIFFKSKVMHKNSSWADSAIRELRAVLILSHSVPQGPSPWIFPTELLEQG